MRPSRTGPWIESTLGSVAFPWRDDFLSAEARRAIAESSARAEPLRWSKQYPVIRVSFADAVGKNPADLPVRLREILAANARRLGLEPAGGTVVGDFGDLIERTAQRYGQKVVLLIDEHNKPILDNIENAEVATAMRDGPRDFYPVIKGAYPHLRFVLLTGMSKFSMVSLFSGLNWARADAGVTRPPWRGLRPISRRFRRWS